MAGNGQNVPGHTGVIPPDINIMNTPKYDRIPQW